tara:strand:+ start:1518 stop:1835 length:318 start_codon:yes stop_codon:yes gene_type:complete
MEETFLEDLEKLPPLYSASIIMQLDQLATEIHMEQKETKATKRFGLLAGVVSLKDPLFFSVEYLNSKERYPLFFRFNIITSDDYLDYLNLNKTINNEERKIKRNH